MSSSFRIAVVFMVTCLHSGLSLAASVPADGTKCVFVTDWDDTIKVSESNSKRAAVARTYFSDRVFAGSPEFYRVMHRRCSVYILSDAPTAFGTPLRRTLRDQGMPLPAEIILRDWYTEKRDGFKRKALERILRENSGPDVHFVFTGDDTQLDPAIYAGLIAAHPDLAGRSGVFIHRIHQAALASRDQVAFTIYPELSAALADDYRFTVIEQASLNASFLRGDAQDIVPNYAKCPERLTDTRLEDGVSAALLQRCPFTQM